MSFRGFKKYKINSEAMSELLNMFERYLVKAYSKTPEQRKIHPFRMAGELEIPIGRVMGLLQIAQDEGVLIPRVIIYCPETETFIGQYTWPERPPEEIECLDHGFETHHQFSECKIELVYEFSSTFRKAEFAA